MMAASESIEHQTLVRHIDKLVLAFKSSPLSIGTELLAKGLVSSEVYAGLLTPGTGNDAKAAQLVMCLKDQIHICPGKYYDFMALPSFQEKWLSSVHEVLTSTYGMLS